MAAAQDFESLEGGAPPEGVIVAAREHGAGQRPGCLLAGALSRKHLLAHRHHKFLAVMRVAGDDVRPQMLEGLPGVTDLLGQVAELPADFVLLVEMHGAELVELADFGVDSDLLHHRGIARGDGLDFGVGQGAAFEVLGAAHRGVAGHDLLVEAGLGLQGLPHIGVERAFGDVAVNLHFRIKIALAQNSALALLDVARAPGRVEMMQGAQAALDVHPCPHFFSGADPDAYPAGVHGLEQIQLGQVAVGVVSVLPRGPGLLGVRLLIRFALTVVCSHCRTGEHRSVL